MAIGETPGPGQYFPKDGNPAHFAFCKQIRSKQLKGGEPGPGRKAQIIQNTRFLQQFRRLHIIYWTPAFTDLTIDPILFCSIQNIMETSKCHRSRVANPYYGQMFKPCIGFEYAKSKGDSVKVGKK